MTMSARRPIAMLCAALLAVGGTTLAGCGGDRSKLIPADRATALDDALQRVADATAAGRCSDAQSALVSAQDAFSAMPSSVDGRLRTRIADGLKQLAATVPTQCAEQRTPTTTAPTTSRTTETTTTTTETTTAPTTTTTEPTTTTPPTTTAPPTSTEPGGGVTPGEGQGSGGQGGVNAG